MPGDVFMSVQDYGAYAGYGFVQEPDLTGAVSHFGFIVWVAVFALVAVSILGGLKVGGYSFVFHR